MAKNIYKFLILFFFGGILAGGVFGIVLGLFMLPLIYDLESTIFFLAVVFIFFIPSICIQLWKKKWGVVIRRLFTAIAVGLFFTAMYALEEEIIPFNDFDWKIIYISVTAAIFLFTLFLILSEFYKDSWLNQEIEHIFKGMKLYGLLPEDEKEDK